MLDMIPEAAMMTRQPRIFELGQHSVDAPGINTALRQRAAPLEAFFYLTDHGGEAYSEQAVAGCAED